MRPCLKRNVAREDLRKLEKKECDLLLLLLLVVIIKKGSAERGKGAQVGGKLSSQVAVKGTC